MLGTCAEIPITHLVLVLFSITVCLYLLLIYCMFSTCRFFVMGATLVLLATFLYGKPESKTDLPPVAEKTALVVKTNIVKIS